MSESTFDIIITANSPGELYGWVRPVIAHIPKEIPEGRIILVIPPCQFASGREVEVAKSLPHIAHVITPQMFRKWIYWRRAPKEIKFSKRGLLVFMGGDLFQARLLAHRLNYPAMAYSQAHFKWAKDFVKFLVADEATRGRALALHLPPDAVDVVGDLMVDSARLGRNGMKPAADHEENAPRILFLSGSRPRQTQYLIPYYLEVSDRIRDHYPKAVMMLRLSPFIPLETALKNLNHPKFRAWKGAKPATRPYQFEPRKTGPEEGFIFSSRLGRITVLKAETPLPPDTDIAVTIPGTNTAELAALGIPMVVVIATNKPEVMVLEGLLGILTSIPIIGTFVKKSILKAMDRHIPFLALPNMKAGKMLVPEIRGDVGIEDTAGAVTRLLDEIDRRRALRTELPQAMGPAGAAQKIAKIIKEAARS